jgi:hypothetical protein
MLPSVDQSRFSRGKLVRYRARKNGKVGMGWGRLEVPCGSVLAKGDGISPIRDQIHDDLLRGEPHVERNQFSRSVAKSV